MIYPSVPSSEQWFLGANPNNDTRFNPKTTVRGDATAGWYLNDDRWKMNVLTSQLYDGQLNCNSNHGQAASRGYMWRDRDWRDVEITGYIMATSTSGDFRFSFYCRAAEHSTPQSCCSGTKYTNSIHCNNSRNRFGKEQWHVSYADY